MQKIGNVLSRFHWRFALIYIIATLGVLLAVALFVGPKLISSLFVPESALTPYEWARDANEQLVPLFRVVLVQSPLDNELINEVLRQVDGTVTSNDVFRLGGIQFTGRTMADFSVAIVGPKGEFLGRSNAAFLPNIPKGSQLDPSFNKELEKPLQAALAGELDIENLFVTLEPDESFLFVIPIYDLNPEKNNLLGAMIARVDTIPTENDLTGYTLMLIGRSLLLFLIGAGLMGILISWLTVRDMRGRFKRFSKSVDAWSEGNFTSFIKDDAGDDISQLASNLNDMAQQLHELLHQQQESAITEERNRLARDLHDSAKQQALAASFQISTALALLDQKPQAARDHLQEAEKLIDGVRSELTDLIHELRPLSMEGRWLAETIYDYTVGWGQRNNIQVDTHVPKAEKDLPSEVKQAIYRIMQEALANVARHSKADLVEITLEYEARDVVLKIHDDGCGFDAQGEYRGMGLGSMHERAQALNGEIRIDSQPGQGTLITTKLPLGGRLPGLGK